MSVAQIICFVLYIVRHWNFWSFSATNSVLIHVRAHWILTVIASPLRVAPGAFTLKISCLNIPGSKFLHRLVDLALRTSFLRHVVPAP